MNVRDDSLGKHSMCAAKIGNDPDAEGTGPFTLSTVVASPHRIRRGNGSIPAPGKVGFAVIPVIHQIPIRLRPSRERIRARPVQRLQE